MAWTTMHFAVGMGCSGAAATAVCFYLKRGWRWIPPVMTLGGVWALIPDMPRIFREDFPSLPLASILGSRNLENNLHHIGDLFGFHRMLDAQPREYALHGLALILIFYNLAYVLMWFLEYRQRNSPGNRALQAHGQVILNTPTRKRKSRRHHSHRHHSHNPQQSTPGPQQVQPPQQSNPDVLHRITPEDHSNAS